MKTIKVIKATGPVLDWLVAKCEGLSDAIVTRQQTDCMKAVTVIVIQPETDFEYDFCPSTDWSQGGPIIDREKISVCPSSSGSVWVAYFPMLPPSKQCFSGGPTPLIAVMRCYIISKLGEEAEIPEGLT